MPSIPRPYDLVAGIRESAEASRWQQVQQAVRGRIEAHSITANEIAAGTITATELAADSVTAAKIAAGAVTATKINVTTLSAISEDVGTITAGTITMAAGGNIHIGHLYIDNSGFFVYGDQAQYGFRSALSGDDVGFLYEGYDGVHANGSIWVTALWEPGSDRMDANAGLFVSSQDDPYGQTEGYFWLAADGALRGSDTTISTSDRRTKSKIRDVRDPLGTVLALRPRSFTRKRSGQPDVGFIAQEMVDVLPDLVFDGMDRDDNLGIKYGSLHAYTVGAIQELAGRVEKLEKG